MSSPHAMSSANPPTFSKADFLVQQQTEGKSGIPMRAVISAILLVNP